MQMDLRTVRRDSLRLLFHQIEKGAKRDSTFAPAFADRRQTVSPQPDTTPGIYVRIPVK